MNRLQIHNARVIGAQQVFASCGIEIQDGKITRVAAMEDFSRSQGVQTFDAQGAYAAPGLIDLHIHGFGGYGPELASQEALLRMSEELAANGVTAFCPTLYCGKPEDMLRIVQSTIGAFGRERGAHILGYHLEGPFISPKKPGVMKPQDIAPVNLEVLEQLVQAARGHICVMTAAPELPGIKELASFCREHGILLQAGHTNATYEEFLRGKDWGITHATHLFNAMSAFNHRAPGAAGAALIHPEISLEIIADGVHVHPDVVAFLKRIKPAENIILVTDALLPTRQKEPPFLANGEEVVFRDGVWKRAADGVIAGSALTMLQGIKNLVSFGYSLPQAVQCASANPARLLGLKNKGALCAGMDADITLFDENFRPVKIFLA